MRRAARVDANQAEIVAALRKAGATVQPIHTIGHGCPDLLAGYHGKTYLIEVKDGNKPPSAQKLTPDEKEWIDAWRGGDVYVISDITSAIAALNSDI
jgi:Holliday junction resolvase